MDQSKQLQSWYAAQCDGHWEHQFGIEIKTLDNPGWFLQVDLKGTSLESRGFTDLQHNRTEDDWISCSVVEGTFRGAGGPGNLSELLQQFLQWAEGS